MRLLIIADDLTGAADCAARCHTAGLASTILVDASVSLLNLTADRPVLSLNLDSRHLSPAAAAAKVGGLAPLLAAARSALFYKKIDSTLRGNIGSELAALLPFLTPLGIQPCAVISPGFPAQKRGLVHGTLVYEQSNTVRHLPSLLAEQTNLPLVLFELAAVRGGVERLAQRLAAAQQSGAQLLVVDGMSDADLQTIVRATRQVLPHALLCGSAGLVLPLAEQLAREALSTPVDSQPRPAGSIPIVAEKIGYTLAIVGSGSAMAQRQIATVARNSAAQIIEVGTQNSDEITLTHGNLVIHLPPPAAGLALDGAAARAMAMSLATVAQRVIEQVQPHSLILVGGDTAQLTMAQLGIRQLDVIAECQAGMPLSVGVDGNGVERRIVLKAGNHGDEESLLELLGQMKVFS